MNPIAFSFLGLDVRWYGLAYVLGFFIGVHLGGRLVARARLSVTREEFETFVFGIFVAGVLGGRFGDFLFYRPEVLLQNPLEVLQIWHGGMSIHGGVLGALGWAAWWTHKYKHKLLPLLDACVVPLAIALGFGRIANYLNGELVGRVTDVSWAVIFPHIDNLPRHPSQLYESGKNFLLAGILFWVFWRGGYKKPGLLTALFLLGYGILRFSVEYFREPETMIGPLTTGQVLSLAMVVGAAVLAYFQNFWRKSKK